MTATLVVAVGLLGIAARIWSAYHARFSPEEASFWATGLDIAELKDFPVLGHSVSGTSARHPGSGFFWIVAASQVLWKSPVAANLWFSAIGFASLAAFALMVARVWSTRAGLVMWALGSLSPWWVIYTNSAWPSYLAPSLCGFFVVLLMRVISVKRSRAVAPLLVLLLGSFQIHLSCIHFWLLTAGALVVYRPALNRKWLIAGAAVGVAIYLPYLLAELQTGFSNTRAILIHSQGQRRSWVALQGLLIYFFGFSGIDIGFLWNQGFWFPFDPVGFWRGGKGWERTTAFFDTAGPVSLLWCAHIAGWLLVLGAIGSMARSGWRKWRAAGRIGRPEPLRFLVLLATVDIVVLFALSGKAGYAHYVNLLLPLSFLPVVALLNAGLGLPGWRVAALGSLLLSMVGGACVLRAYYRIDSRWSAAQSDAVVKFVLARTRRGASGQVSPFQMRFEFSPAWQQPYAILAARRHQASWPVTYLAPDVFLVGVRTKSRRLAVTDRAADSSFRPSENQLDLETIFVRQEQFRTPPAVDAGGTAPAL